MSERISYVVETILLTFIVVVLVMSIYMNWQLTVELQEQATQMESMEELIQFYSFYCGNVQQVPIPQGPGA